MHIVWSMVIPEEVVPVNRATLRTTSSSGPVSVDYL